MLACIDNPKILVIEGPGVMAAAIMRIARQEEQISELSKDDQPGKEV